MDHWRTFFLKDHPDFLHFSGLENFFDADTFFGRDEYDFLIGVELFLKLQQISAHLVILLVVVDEVGRLGQFLQATFKLFYPALDLPALQEVFALSFECLVLENDQV